MTDTGVLPTVDEKLIPYNDFSDWLSSISVNLEENQFLLRWKTIHRLFIDEVDDTDAVLSNSEWADNLLSLALGDLKSEPNLAEYLCAELKKDDIMYSNAGGKNNEELQVLAAYCLRLMLDDELWVSSFTALTALKIQAASLCGKRTFKGSMDLLSVAMDQGFSTSRTLRRSNKITPPASYFTKSETFESAFTVLEDYNPSVNYNTDAIKALKDETFRQLSNTQKSLHRYAALLETQMGKLAEEQEVLWFITAAWSEAYEKPYSELSIEQRILDLSVELSRRTLIESELPSIKGLAAKLGVCSDEVTLTKFIDSLSEDKVIDVSEYYEKATSLSPILYALKLASNGSWKSKWKSSTNVDYNVKLDAKDILLQLYRELLAMKWS